MAAHPALRLVMRGDQAASAYFIPVSLIAVVVLATVDLPHPVVIAIWLFLSVVAIWLALAGVLMAWGLSAAMVRGEDLPDKWWESMLMFDDRL